MVKGRSIRIPVNLDAKLILGDAVYEVVIVNISEVGVNVETVPGKTTIDLAPGTALELKFQISSEEVMSLNCNVIWLFKTPPDGATNTIGLEIIDIPPAYEDFYKTLYINYMGIP